MMMCGQSRRGAFQNISETGDLTGSGGVILTSLCDSHNPLHDN